MVPARPRGLLGTELGSRGASGHRAEPPGAAPPRLGESSSAPRDQGPLFGALITSERLPRVLCGRGGAGDLGAEGSWRLGGLRSPLLPH